MLFLQSTTLKDISLSPRKAKRYELLAGHLAYSPDHKKSQQKHKKFCCTSNQASQTLVAETAQRLEKPELQGKNSPIFLQKIFE